MRSRPITSDFLIVAIVVCLAAVLLALPAILNGAPLLYVDTSTYIAQGQVAVLRLFPGVDLDTAALPKVQRELQELTASGPQSQPLIIGGRSIYYGAFTYLSYAASNGWAAVLAQGAALAYPIARLMRSLAPGIWIAGTLICAAVLAFLTPAGFFVGLLMPDVWVGAMVLSLAGLAVLPPGPGYACARMGLVLIAALAVLFHLSHLALLVAMSGLGALAWIVSHRLRARLRAGLAVWLVIVIAVGGIGQVLFSYMIERTYGAPPVSRPHLTAHLVDMGPGTDFVRQTCGPGAATEPLAVCAYADRLPVGWVDFLFDADPETGIFEIAPTETRRQMAEEDLRFALLTLQHDPVGTTLGLLRDGVVQIGRVAVYGIVVTPWNDSQLVSDFPPELARATRESLVYAEPGWIETLTRLSRASTAVAALLLVLLWVPRIVVGHPTGGRDMQADPRLLALAMAICLTGLVGNALICGILASPYPRFQARITWIFPTMVMLTLFARYGTLLQLASTRTGPEIDR